MPIPQPTIAEVPSGGEVLGVIETKTVMVKFRDGYGKQQVRMAVVVPGGDVYLVSEIGTKEYQTAQGWLKSAIIKKMAEQG